LGLPDWTIRSASGLWAQAFLQRFIDQEFKVRFGHRGVFLSKLPLKGWTGGRDVLFTRLLLSFTSLLIQCLAFLG
jgi:hypothetical protein